MSDKFCVLTEELDHPEGVVANVGEWHLLIGDIGQTGAPLFYPEL